MTVPTGPAVGVDRRRARGTPAAVEDATRLLEAAYARAETRLRGELDDLTVRLLEDPTLRGAAARRAQVRAVLSDVAELRDELDGRARLFARGTLARLYAEGVRRADRAIGLDPGAGSFGTAHRRALATIAGDTFDDLAAATSFLEENTKRVLREATRLQVAVGAASGASVPEDTARLVTAFRRDGVTAFVARNGARWRLGPYAGMVARTKSASAYNTATVLEARRLGTDAFLILDGVPSGHEECVAYNGRTCSGAWAFAHPIQHPNCVRSIGPLPLHTGPVDYGGTTANPDTPTGGAPLGRRPEPVR